MHLRPTLEYQRVVGAEQVEQVLWIAWGPSPLRGVVDEVEGAEDVVCVFGSVLWHGALEDDLLRFSQLELRPLDPVREVRLDEGERRERARLVASAFERVLQQGRMQGLEQLDAARVEAESGVRRASGRGCQLDVSRAEDRADQVVEGCQLSRRVDRLRDLARLVAQLSKRLPSTDGGNPRQLVLEFRCGQGPGTPSRALEPRMLSRNARGRLEKYRPSR